MTASPAEQLAILRSLVGQTPMPRDLRSEEQVEYDALRESLAEEIAHDRRHGHVSDQEADRRAERYFEGRA